MKSTVRRGDCTDRYGVFHINSFIKSIIMFSSCSYLEGIDGNRRYSMAWDREKAGNVYIYFLVLLCPEKIRRYGTVWRKADID